MIDDPFYAITTVTGTAFMLAPFVVLMIYLRVHARRAHRTSPAQVFKGVAVVGPPKNLLLDRYNITPGVRDLLVTKTYPGITIATIEMAYDNGGVNRECSEMNVGLKLSEYLRKSTMGHMRLREIDWWFVTLTRDEMVNVVSGEEREADRLLAGAPPLTRELLVSIFDNVV